MSSLPFYWLPSLAIMWGLGPMIGTMVIVSFWRRPELILANELIGIPILLYSYITVSPVLIPASMLWCFTVSLYLERKLDKRNRRSFFLFTLQSGIVFGLLCAILPVVSALFSGEFSTLLPWLTTGVATGISCAVLCFPIWSRQMETT